jgi:choline-phosphate cytidylyltransferase
MIKVITYGTYDMLHYGHIKLLERAKNLGDYLIVGITSDSFDRARGKINVKQTLEERVSAVRKTGIADEIIVEEYEGQKIDDIRRYNIDIFTVGSDWKGHFDYLKEYCEVVYLERTKGISSSDLRSEERKLKIGLVGNSHNELEKFARESKFVNGTEITAIFLENQSGCNLSEELFPQNIYAKAYKQLLDKVDAIYLVSNPEKHYEQIKLALCEKKHVLCESPIAIGSAKARKLFEIARKNNCILMESLKTAYALAFLRLQLIIKSGFIGQVLCVDATCTSLRKDKGDTRGSLYSWGPFGLLAVFSTLGTEYISKSIQTKLDNTGKDVFTKIDFKYKNSVASVKVANGVKSEGELIIAGTEGYIYVPAPWWKTDYFEVRYEEHERNKRYFYQLEGEGIRYTIVSFLKSVTTGTIDSCIPQNITLAIADIMQAYKDKNDIFILK